MNILVRSTYRQSDGWGRAALDYLKAFTLTGHEVRATPIILSNQLRETLPEWVKEDNTFKPDFVFQQCLPEYFESYPLTAGMGFTETSHLENTGWVEPFNRMDKVVVATEQERVNLLNSGVTKPLYVINMPMELKEGVESDSLRRYIKDRYCFYFVGEYVERKNIESLIMAYYREFKRHERVVLLIKTGFGNFSPMQVKEYIERNLASLQNRMRLYRYDHHYPEIIFMTEKLSDEEMAFVEFKDSTNKVSGVMVPKEWLEYRQKLFEGNKLMFIGVRGSGNKHDSLIINRVMQL